MSIRGTLAAAWRALRRQGADCDVRHACRRAVEEAAVAANAAPPLRLFSAPNGDVLYEWVAPDKPIVRVRFAEDGSVSASCGIIDETPLPNASGVAAILCAAGYAAKPKGQRAHQAGAS